MSNAVAQTEMFHFQKGEEVIFWGEKAFGIIQKPSFFWVDLRRRPSKRGHFLSYIDHDMRKAEVWQITKGRGERKTRINGEGDFSFFLQKLPWKISQTSLFFVIRYKIFIIFKKYCISNFFYGIITIDLLSNGGKFEFL